MNVKSKYVCHARNDAPLSVGQCGGWGRWIAAIKFITLWSPQIVASLPTWHYKQALKIQFLGKMMQLVLYSSLVQFPNLREVFKSVGYNCFRKQCSILPHTQELTLSTNALYKLISQCKIYCTEQTCTATHAAVVCHTWRYIA